VDAAKLRITGVSGTWGSIVTIYVLAYTDLVYTDVTLGTQVVVITDGCVGGMDTSTTNRIGVARIFGARISIVTIPRDSPATGERACVVYRARVVVVAGVVIW
tara:strand:- start:987 stop:1295 length:309 start_codon:yes stop_codon:yes gene_type:complete